MILPVIFGLIGGVTRAFVGLLKYYNLNKRGKLKLSYILFTVIASGFIGVFCGLLVSQSYVHSMLAGYAGTDLIEGIYKIRKRQGILI